MGWRLASEEREKYSNELDGEILIFAAAYASKNGASSLQNRREFYRKAEKAAGKLHSVLGEILSPGTNLGHELLLSAAIQANDKNVEGVELIQQCSQQTDSGESLTDAQVASMARALNDGVTHLKVIEQSAAEIIAVVSRATELVKPIPYDPVRPKDRSLPANKVILDRLVSFYYKVTGDIPRAHNDPDEGPAETPFQEFVEAFFRQLKTFIPDADMRPSYVVDHIVKARKRVGVPSPTAWKATQTR
jgi:hypothetical protein